MKNSIEIIKYASVDSTNTQAKRLIESGKNGAFLVLADGQTAGRGRQGKTFYSPAGTGLYMSLAYPLSREIKDAVSSTSAAAVAVCRAIEALTELKPEIKWVNDIYVNGKKVCGILTEAVEPKTLIIGIGVNLSTESFPEYADCAASLNCGVDKTELAEAIIDELLKIIDCDYAEFLPYYRSHSFLINKEITFIKDGVQTAAKVMGIDDSCGLVVELSDGKRLILRGGEISVNAV